MAGVLLPSLPRTRGATGEVEAAQPVPSHPRAQDDMWIRVYYIEGVLDGCDAEYASGCEWFSLSSLSFLSHVRGWENIWLSSVFTHIGNSSSAYWAGLLSSSPTGHGLLG